MAETPSKRQREETQERECEDPKRHKSYNHILSILEEEEDVSDQDLSYIFTTLQQELSSGVTAADPSPCLPGETDPDQQTSISDAPSPHAKDAEGDDRENVIRHLLEASDDELGIPRVDGGDDETINGGDHSFVLCDEWWEFEDETANYNTLLQSELFM